MKAHRAVVVYRTRASLHVPNVLVRDTLIVTAATSADAMRIVERYVTERSDHPVIRLTVTPYLCPIHILTTEEL